MTTHKVDIKPSCCLDHADHSIGHRNQPLIDQLVGEWVTGQSLHDVRLGLLVSHGDGGHHVGAQVDAEDGDGAEGQRDVAHDKEQKWTVR